MSNGSMNRKLFEFYHSQSRPWSEVWILKKIHAISDCQAEACLNDECANYKFKVVRGSNNNEFMFSYADLPLMNSHDWFMLFSVFDITCLNDELLNYKVRVVRRINNKEFMFSFVDLPLMNPHEWFMLFSIFNMDNEKYVNQIIHLKKIIRFYFLEICKMDVELAEFLKKKKTSIGPCDQANTI